MGLIYEDLTHQLIGCFFDVHNSLGVGYDEPTYHRALQRLFRRKEIEHSSKERRALIHRGRSVREFEADFITFDKIIVELKALQSGFIRANYVQIISELKLWQKSLGLLVNFGLQKVVVERIPFTEKTPSVQENYDYIRDLLAENDRLILARLRDAVFHVFATHGIGYGEATYRKLIEAELDFRKITYQNRVALQVSYNGEIVNLFKMKPLLIENQLICDVKALDDKIDFYDIAKMQSYLRAMGLRIGILVKFGKTELEIRGIRA